MIPAGTTINKIWGSGSSYAHIPEFRASLECELEGIRNPGTAVEGFDGKKDGSLRNNGFEYVSNEALDREGLVEAFKRLHKTLTFYDKHDPFSIRTSTHVHVNMSCLKHEDVRKLLLLYALFEECFFAMVKPVRRDNIHCVPLTDTYLPKDYNHDLSWLVDHWHKYTALNLKRLADLGTVEFRHLHGTGDAEEIDVWLHVLENLWKLCQRVEVDASTLSDPKQRESWFDLIFFPSHQVMALRSSLPNIIRNSLVDVKFSTL